MVALKRQHMNAQGEALGICAFNSCEVLKERDTADAAEHVFRPFRAEEIFRYVTQGCALGSRISLFQSEQTGELIS